MYVGGSSYIGNNNACFQTLIYKKKKKIESKLKSYNLFKCADI